MAYFMLWKRKAYTLWFYKMQPFQWLSHTSGRRTSLRLCRNTKTARLGLALHLLRSFQKTKRLGDVWGLLTLCRDTVLRSPYVRPAPGSELCWGQVWWCPNSPACHFAEAGWTKGSSREKINSCFRHRRAGQRLPNLPHSGWLLGSMSSFWNQNIHGQ